MLLRKHLNIVVLYLRPQYEAISNQNVKRAKKYQSRREIDNANHHIYEMFLVKACKIDIWKIIFTLQKIIVLIFYQEFICNK